MNLSSLLDVLIGLVLVYLVMSVLCSGINELLAQHFSRRGRFLREGLLNMLGDRSTYLQLINHGIVASFYRDLPGKPKTPSYIPAAHFAQALFDVIRMRAAIIQAQLVDGSGQAVADKDKVLAEALARRDQKPLSCEALRQAAITCRNYGFPAAAALVPLLDAAGGDLAAAQKNVEDWFNSTMDRVSGWYKAHSQKILLAIGIAAAVLLNVDSIELIRGLAGSEQLRTALAATAARVAGTSQFAGVTLPVAQDQPADAPALTAPQLQQLAAGLKSLQGQGLPVGFSCLTRDSEAGLKDIAAACRGELGKLGHSGWLLKILGWLITGFAAGLGAPFWFELLGKLISLRSAGPKPEPAKPAKA